MLGYFGPAGTFTHQALLSLGLDEEARPYATVPGTLDAVRDGVVRAGLVPIENSVEGGVTATLDNLAVGRPLVIVGEVLLPVQFGLYVRPGVALDDIRKVLTHPHAAAQTRGWIAAHLPHAEVTEGGSTAAAAAEVAKPDSAYDAAVCAAVAGEMYGLEAAASQIADNPDAVTRFILVSRPCPPPAPTGHDKTTLIAYMREDHSGALLEILEQFASRGVNLCRIESRPTREGLGNYCFSIDAEGHLADTRIADALMGLHRTCKRVDFLGSYPRADLVEATVPKGHRESDYAKASAWLRSLSAER
ncbi:MAG TPA: prephenate dehydratase [Propionibacteriaceae bacterium]|nr:prephenate dehydratase [Propionibacteriaceae bacterium]HQE31221.1 prephenate dehydratase [Propionibacteriaceae bacterium]